MPELESKDGQPQPRKLPIAVSNTIQVSPTDVVGVGLAVLTAGAVAGGVSTYRKGSKSLMEDGINPSIRMRMIPVAAKTLMLSSLFTGLLGIGGFYALRSAGFFTTDHAELPSAAEAARMLRGPRAYIREMTQKEKAEQEKAAT
uniref:Transmembrane protein 242 n=1 Tax=Chlamydomonas leiostraca TaxID=1034604 RepID=A0A7S0WRG9_9CHLO|mmetsp:Transcript_2405/g.6080  ORF Transcript_2405/g.6080 Transcript_2405/m.6080 type:complete len:144 (+) Transcript_2405:83-514(+)